MTIPKFAYESEVTIKTSSSGDITTNDVNNLFVFRAPFTKTSSFSAINIPIDIGLYQAIDDDIRKNNHPQLNLKINLASNDYSTKSSIRSFNTKVGGINNQYKIIHCSARENPDSANNTIPVTFFILNKVLFELSKTKSYNKIFENKSALEILDDYETHLNKNFGGGNLFNFKKFLSEENNHKYKQSLIKTENDLLVPSWILNNMKPSNNLSYYFFDDFIPLENYGLLNGLLITLSKENIKTFEVVDTTDPSFQDISLRSQIIKTEAISDISGVFNGENATLNIYTPKNKFTVSKGKESNVVSAKQGGSEKDQIMDGRPVENRSYDSTSSTSNIRANGINIYACDNEKDAKTRYDNIGNLIKTDIEYMVTYETKEIHFDAFQFFKSYKMNQELEDYLFIPINITNTFSKYSKRETTLAHGAKFQFLVYKI